jgi:hypothetical protein
VMMGTVAIDPTEEPELGEVAAEPPENLLGDIEVVMGR